MRAGTVVLAVSVLLVTCAVAHAQDQQSSQTQAAPKSKPLRITFYPLLVRAPLFGASVDVPQVPGGGGEGGDQSGSTDYSFNAAYMAGFAIEAPRWFAEANGLWAALSASHSLPLTTVNSDFYFFSARGGIRMFRNVSGTVGVRRVSVGLDVQLTPPVATPASGSLRGSVKPGLWDPLLGLDWRASAGDRWTFNAFFQGGGFGVGADVDLEGDFYADWHVARHFDVRLGYTALYYKLTIDGVNIGSLQRTLVTKQTLQGPAIGFGIVF
jgi:hypothetical protein